MHGSSQVPPESERGGYGVRHQCDDGPAHNSDLFDNLNTKSQLPIRRVVGRGAEKNGDQSEGPPEHEIDDERESLIAGFEEYLKKYNLEEGDLTRGKQVIKLEEQSQAVPGKSKLFDYKKCDKEPVYLDTTDTTSHKQQIKLTDCRRADINNETMTKYDHRRDGFVALDSGKNTAKNAVNYKKTYLFLYNLAMFIMFLMVNLILIIETLSQKMDDDSVRGAASIIRLLTYTQLLESIHPLLGLVPGGPLMPLLQVFGRLLVNQFLTDTDIRVNSFPYAHYLFIVWSSIEIFRYSFYALRVFNVDIYPITWGRYTLFMPLYPMGGFCEAQIVMSTVKQLEKTRAYTIELPNSANFSFSLPLFLRFYTVALLGPSIVYLMRYMWSQRCKQLKVKAD